MTASTEKRKAVLINTAYVVLLLSAFYLFMRYAFWVFAPFIFAFFAATALQRPTNAIANKIRLKKGLVSVLIVLLAVGIFFVLASLVGARLVSEVRGLAASLLASAEDLPDFIRSVEASLLNAVGRLPDGIRETLSDAIENFSDKLLLSSAERESAQGIGQSAGFDLSLLATPLSSVWSTAKQIPGVLVGFLIFVIASCFITSDYDKIVNFVKRQLSPEKRRNLSKTKKIVYTSVGKLVKSYVLIMLITFGEMCVGLFALRIFGIYNGSYILAIALLTAVVDIFPVLGTGTVLLPWAVFCLVTDSYGMGIGLLIIYGCITVIRQIVEPKIVASNLGIPPIVSIMGMYIGLQLFGVLGIFIMPMVITVMKVLNDEGVVRIWKRAKAPASVPPPEQEEKNNEAAPQ